MSVHLKALERAFGIDFWRDKRIKAGDYWTTKIADAIALARIHVLLVTPNFINSNYIFDHELPAINDKYRQGDLVVPVVLQRCTWQPFVAALQAVPMSEKGRLQAVKDWKPQDHGFHAACEQIQGAIEGFLGRPPASPFVWSPRP